MCIGQLLSGSRRQYMFTDYCRAEPTRDKTGLGTIDVEVPPTFTSRSTRHYGGSPPLPSRSTRDGGELYMTTVQCCGSSFSGGIFRLEVDP